MPAQQSLDWLTELFAALPDPAPVPAPYVAPQPAREAPVAPEIRRHFYRCTGCLDVVALPARLDMDRGASVARCATCAQLFEYMGRVEKDRLWTEHTACKCDTRCTDARGPLCSCKCGGRNHGAGMAGFVTVSVDHGAPPIVSPPSAARAAKLLRDYQAYVALRGRVQAVRYALMDRKKAAGWLDRPDFDRLRQLDHLVGRSWKARTHASRMKLLNAAGV